VLYVTTRITADAASGRKGKIKVEISDAVMENTLLLHPESDRSWKTTLRSWKIVSAVADENSVCPAVFP